MHRAKETAQQLAALVALPENPGLVLRTHIEQLINAFNSSSKIHTDIHTHIHVHIHTILIKLQYKVSVGLILMKKAGLN